MRCICACRKMYENSQLLSIVQVSMPRTYLYTTMRNDIFSLQLCFPTHCTALHLSFDSSLHSTLAGRLMSSDNCIFLQKKKSCLSTRRFEPTNAMVNYVVCVCGIHNVIVYSTSGILLPRCIYQMWKIPSCPITASSSLALYCSNGCTFSTDIRA